MAPSGNRRAGQARDAREAAVPSAKKKKTDKELRATNTKLDPTGRTIADEIAVLLPSLAKAGMSGVAGTIDTFNAVRAAGAEKRERAQERREKGPGVFSQQPVVSSQTPAGMLGQKHAAPQGDADAVRASAGDPSVANARSDAAASGKSGDRETTYELSKKGTGPTAAYDVFAVGTDGKRRFMTRGASAADATAKLEAKLGLAQGTIDPAFLQRAAPAMPQGLSRDQDAIRRAIAARPSPIAFEEQGAPDPRLEPQNASKPDESRAADQIAPANVVSDRYKATFAAALRGSDTALAEIDRLDAEQRLQGVRSSLIFKANPRNPNDLAPLAASAQSLSPRDLLDAVEITRKTRSNGREAMAKGMDPLKIENDRMLTLGLDVLAREAAKRGIEIPPDPAAHAPRNDPGRERSNRQTGADHGR